MARFRAKCVLALVAAALLCYLAPRAVAAAAPQESSALGDEAGRDRERVVGLEEAVSRFKTGAQS